MFSKRHSIKLAFDNTKTGTIVMLLHILIGKLSVATFLLFCQFYVLMTIIMYIVKEIIWFAFFFGYIQGLKNDHY